MSRPTVLTTKVVHLAQLAFEAGGALCRNSETGAIVAADGAQITQAGLEGAVDAHVADPYWGEPEDRKAIRLAVDKAKAVLAGTDSYTSAEVQQIIARIVLFVARRLA